MLLVPDRTQLYKPIHNTRTKKEEKYVFPYTCIILIHIYFLYTYIFPIVYADDTTTETPTC